MSTEHQQYSPQNQAATIQSYAERHGFQIVRTYFDPAKSGLVLRTRQALRQLLKDVVCGEADYKAILVYDVSRWGRFQDTDESAHYEFVCKSVGVKVHYCAEPFANDDTLASAVIKTLKRTMAGEYSRELGVKVLDGQKRLAQLGFKQGGSAGYGLRRLLISPAREPKQALATGERKSIATDRVILVPGPDDEVRNVQAIYRMFISDGLSMSGIARMLNRKHVPCPNRAKHWNVWAIHSILTRPKYCGRNVYNRTSNRLCTPRIKCPESDWVIVPGAFQALIDEQTFDAAQGILRRLTRHKSDGQLLQDLRNLLHREGRLSHTIVERSAGMAGISTYAKRFGGLRQAYKRIGYGSAERHDPLDKRSQTQTMKERLVDKLLAAHADQLSMVKQNAKFNPQLQLRNGTIVSVCIVASTRTGAVGNVRWRVRPGRKTLNLLTLMARLDESNQSFLDFHLVPRFEGTKEFYIRRDDRWLARGVRLEKIEDFVSNAHTLSYAAQIKTALGTKS